MQTPYILCLVNSTAKITLINWKLLSAQIYLWMDTNLYRLEIQ
jgi:hypothetical protein